MKTTINKMLIIGLLCLISETTLFGKGQVLKRGNKGLTPNTKNVAKEQKLKLRNLQSNTTKLTPQEKQQPFTRSKIKNEEQQDLKNNLKMPITRTVLRK